MQSQTPWPNQPSSVVVVGAGAVGLCVAWSLHKAGVDVTVVEAGKVGRGSSWGNAGWLVPSLSAPLAGPGVAKVALKMLGRASSPFWVAPRADRDLVKWFWSFWRAGSAQRFEAGFRATIELGQDAPELYDKLSAEVGGWEHTKQGLLFCFLSAAKAEAELAGLAMAADYGYDLPERVMTGDQVRALEPVISQNVVAGFAIAEESHIDPGALTNALAQALRDAGVDVREGERVTKVDTSPSTAVVRTESGSHSADVVVLAAGAWTPEIARTVGLDVPMQAAKGYSVTADLPTRPGRPLYLGEAKVGVTPFRDRVRLAGTFELSGVNLRIDDRRVDAMLLGAKPFLADLDAARVRDVWTGMRPMSPDSLPIIGPVPGEPRVVLATGHGMLGITLAPATGEALTKGLMDGRPPPVLRPFDAGRF